jgi:hypothetical protein
LVTVSLSFRSRVEHASAPLVTLINRVPRAVAFLAVLGLLVVGILVPRVGFVFTFLVAGFVGWLLYLTWPQLARPERYQRIAVLCLVVAVGIVQAFPR